MNPKNKTNHPDLLEKAFQFLRCIGTSAEVRHLLARAGYAAADHAEGSRLLVKVSNLEDGQAPVSQAADVAAALAALNAWDEQGFRRARAALTRLHPEQEAFVFQNLAPTRGPDAVLGVTVFLDRLDALESSSERVATRAADQAALATLAKRGLDDQERLRLRKLVDRALSSPDGETDTADTMVAQRQADLAALAGWYDDWSETARVVVDRRDLLIRLGLVRRRKPGTTTPPPPVVSTTPTSSSGTAVDATASGAVSGTANGAITGSVKADLSANGVSNGTASLPVLVGHIS